MDGWGSQDESFLSAARHATTFPVRPAAHRPRRAGRLRVLDGARGRGSREPARAAGPASALVRARGRHGGAGVLADLGLDPEAGGDFVVAAARAPRITRLSRQTSVGTPSARGLR